MESDSGGDVEIRDFVVEIMSSIRKYQPPSWSCPPKYKCYLEVMKNGSIVDTIDISERSHYIIGMCQNLCELSTGGYLKPDF